MGELKPIEFRGDSLSALKSFPESARRRAGFQLSLVQQGRDPDDWKPMTQLARAFVKFASGTSAESFA
jgi:phage-related protein